MTENDDEVLDLNTIDLDTGRNYGGTFFRTHPRVGEIVTLDVDGEGRALEVLIVAHSSEAIGSDIYVKDRGAFTAYLETIRDK